VGVTRQKYVRKIAEACSPSAKWKKEWSAMDMENWAVMVG